VTRLSARTAWPRVPNALAEAVTARRAQGLRTLDLTASNPTAVFPQLPHDDVLAGLGDPLGRAYLPEPQGLLSAREAVAAYYAARGASVDPAQVVLTASTSEGYGWLFKLLCDPGDRVLVGRPGYPLFDDLARLEGVTLAPVPLRREAHWGIDLDALDDAVDPRTRALSVVHPNNPTGHFVSDDDRASLLARCAARGLALIVDEVFLDYGWDAPTPRARTFAGEVDALTFTLSGLSKVCAAPQVKLGWIVVSGPRAQRDEALARLELIADCYLSVSTAAQRATARLLARSAETREVLLRRVRENRATLRGALHPGSCITLGPAEAGWYATARLPRTRSEQDWALDLLRAGALAQPGWFYEFEDEAWLVLSLLTPAEDFAEGLAALTRLADGA
jgi:aspartate/methionine/tyrosine aminotransferase